MGENTTHCDDFRRVIYLKVVSRSCDRNGMLVIFVAQDNHGPEWDHLPFSTHERKRRE